MLKCILHTVVILFFSWELVYAQEPKTLTFERIDLLKPVKEVDIPSAENPIIPSEENQEDLDSIQHLGKVVIISPFSFDNKEARRKYLILRYKTRKVWPYAVLAADRLNELQGRLETLDTKREKAAYTRRVQRYMEDEFKEQLKKLTRTEGQILVKLLYRQTGDSTFDVIRDLRSGFRAFRYNLTAGMFSISLKREYDPYEVKEDYVIEHILQWAFQHNQLEYQPAAVDIDYEELMKTWENDNLLD